MVSSIPMFLTLLLILTSICMGNSRKKRKVTFEELIKIAQKGDVAAQLLIGTMYFEGEKIPRNIKEARKWLLLAAKQGEPEAQSMLGLAYSIGDDDVKQNVQEAVKWSRLAAEQGFAPAQYILGLMLSSQDLGQPNYQEARKWLNLAAQQGLEQAQEALDKLHQEKQDKKPSSATKNSKESTQDGHFVPQNKHVPTGNFLDDVFRHTDLTHSQRIDLWDDIVRDSIPTITTSQLEFVIPAYVYPTIYEMSLFGISVTFDGFEKKQRGVYYYTSAIEVLADDEDGRDDGAVMVSYDGFFLYTIETIYFIPWDHIQEINIDKNGRFYELSTSPYKTESLKFTLYFDSSVYDGCLKELQVLKRVCDLRIKQIDPYRDYNFIPNEPHEFLYLGDEDSTGDFADEIDVEKLCNNYAKKIKSKNAHDTSKAPSKPSKSEKPLKTTEKTSEISRTKATTPSPKKPKVDISIPSSGPSTNVDFWEALKPHFEKLRHKEFSQIKIKDTHDLNAKPTVIVGVYNSIVMRVKKKELRLELYIDTETEEGNLQILDHIKKNIKVPSKLKGRIEFDRKEGRNAQRIYVSLPGFELSDRSCWADYIAEIVDLTDDFFDAGEAPMRDLIE